MMHGQKNIKKRLCSIGLLIVEVEEDINLFIYLLSCGWFCRRMHARVTSGSYRTQIA
jgi:hypothetical protein